jgi:16S rRNA (cytosine967-C5)-methyltransferase
VLNQPARRDEIIASLEEAGLRVELGRLLRSAFAVGGGSPARTEAFRRGWISIQDEASQAIPLLLDVQAGDRVADLCAAPGGKTAVLARAAGPRGMVVAADRHAHRLRAMRDQFARLGLRDVRAVELDATHALPFREPFQRILLDAPCSGTGTLARHPEIRWRLRAGQLAELHAMQVAMLRAAAERLAPGGRLVYSTCSFEAEENEAVVAEVLAGEPSLLRVPFPEAARGLAANLAAGVSVEFLFDPEGNFRTMPGETATDGFFAAVLEKS